MALKEQDIVFTGQDANGNTVIQMPITRAANVEDAILTVNGISPDSNGNVAITSVNSATKATQDESGNNIKASYGATLAVSNAKVSLKNKNGTVLSEVTVNNVANATAATKATQDGNGATISSTYAKLSGAAFTGAVSTSSTLTASGACKAGSFQATSDYRLKEDFEAIEGALEKVSQLGGLIYSFKADQERVRYAGVIAQDVRKVLPEAVRIDEKGFYCVDYNGVLALMLEAIKEIDQKVKELKNG